MKKYTLLALSLATIVGLVGLSSCSKDDPAPRPQVSFARATQTISEGVGVAEVEVVLDVAAGEDITVDFDVDGTALEGAASTSNSDYEITSGSGEVTIRKGQTTGVIEIKVKDDGIYEGDEIIELEITSVSSSGVDITEGNTIAITITENDAQPIASFTTNKATFNEDDGSLELEVTLDRAAPQDIVLTYSIENQDMWQEGSALLANFGDEQEIPEMYWDYYINDEVDAFGQVTIPQGETTANIVIRAYTDFMLELNETIDFKLTGSNGNTAAIATAASKNSAEVTLAQQNGKAVELYWGTTSANLDLYFFGGTDMTNLFDMTNNFFLGGSAYAQKSSDPVDAAFEATFLPFVYSEIRPTVDTYGISCNYRSGNVNDLDFEVYYGNFIDGDFVESSIISFDGNYTLANINDIATGTDPAIIQTFERDGEDYVDFSPINEPATGSRVKGGVTHRNVSVRKGIKGTAYNVNGRAVYFAGSPTILFNSTRALQNNTLRLRHR